LSERWVIHPTLLAAYFVLALLGLNITQVRPQEALRALLFVLLAAGLLWLGLRAMMKNGQRAGVIVTLLLGLFFTYGHVYHLLEQCLPALGRHRVLLPIWLGLAGIGLWWALRKLRSLGTATRLLNLTALVLLIFPLYQTTSWALRQAQGSNPSIFTQAGFEQISAPEPAPDIYFIVLDEYTRADVLQSIFAYDNSIFLDELRGMGFSVVECAQSNYAQTELVLSSVLNMNYVTALGDFSPDSDDHARLRQLIKNSAVEQALGDLGYQMVAFETGYTFSEMEDADFYFTAGRRSLLSGLSRFEVLLLRSTAGLALIDFAQVLPDFLVPDLGQPLDDKRTQVLFTLDMLERIPGEIAGPKFVFAHIILPHPPFVFDEQGNAVNYPEPLSAEEYAKAYRAQVIYLNQRLLPLLQTILAESNPPPIIILQGDTGPGRVSHSGRMAILSALYLPGYADVLPTSLTPVNNFRLVFDAYFNASLTRLEDDSYFSLYTAPYDFEPVPNTCTP
jgi:hypothetical protein